MRLAKKTFLLSFAFMSFLLLIPSVEANDAPKNQSFEAKYVHSFLLYCLPAITAGESTASIAEASKLPELSSTAEAAFLNGKPGKVFAIPEAGGGIVLTAPNAPMCSVLILKLDSSEFVKEIDFWFDPNHTPFHLDENKTLDNGEIQRKYKAKIHDKNILVLVSIRTKPVAGAIQAMITGGITSD